MLHIMIFSFLGGALGAFAAVWVRANPFGAILVLALALVSACYAFGLVPEETAYGMNLAAGEGDLLLIAVPTAAAFAFTLLGVMATALLSLNGWFDRLKAF